MDFEQLKQELIAKLNSCGGVLKSPSSEEVLIAQQDKTLFNVLFDADFKGGLPFKIVSKTKVESTTFVTN